MAYIPNPQDPTQPTTNQLAGNMAYELQALKGYIQSLIASGTNFNYIGGFRNRLKNGSFNISQRGNITALNGASMYTLDQWLVSPTGGNVPTSQGGAPNGPTPQAKFFAMAPAAGCTGFSVEQRVEYLDCLDLVIGTPVTISGFYKVSSAAAPLPILATFTPLATVDTFSSVISGAAAATIVISPVIANTWQFFSTTFTLITDCTKGLSVQFQLNFGAGFTCNFANLQLEKGSVHTQFEYRPVSYELQQCQRYYQQSNNFISIGYQLIGAGFSQTIPLPVNMRTTPPVVVGNFVTATNATTPTITAANAQNLLYNCFATATGPITLGANYTASAEL